MTRQSQSEITRPFAPNLLKHGTMKGFGLVLTTFCVSGCKLSCLLLTNYITFEEEILALPHLFLERIPVLNGGDHDLSIAFQSKSLMEPSRFLFSDLKLVCGGFITERIETEKTMKLNLLLLTMIISVSAPTVSFGDEQSGPGIEKKGTEVRLEVVKAKLIEKGSFLDVQFRIRGGLGNPNIFMRYAKSAYVIEESTGEKFAAWRSGRIGALGQKRLDEGPISFVKINNAGGKIKKDSRITFVIRGLRQEHIVVEE